MKSYNLMGQKIWEQHNFLGSSINISGFEKGIYFIVFANEK